MIKNLPAKQETQVRSLGQEDPLEEEMATYLSILAWEILWTEEPGGYSLWGHKEQGMIQQLNNNNLGILSTVGVPAPIALTVGSVNPN